MRVVYVHNEYGKFSGEEAAVDRISELLKNHGHEVIRFNRKSSEIPNMGFGKILAFFSGIYSRGSRKQMCKIIQGYQPDIIQVQNLYPLISPSVLLEANQHNIPLVMRCANYRLICPNGLLMTNGQICEKCSGGREWWCLFRNCEGNQFKSFGYALRNYVARKRRYFLDNVTIYYAQTEFQRRRLIQEDFPADRFFVIPNMVNPDGIDVSEKLGRYVGYAGRISPEKGVPTLMEAGKQCGDILFKAAGSFDRMSNLPREAPENFEFCGHLNKEQLGGFYTNSRIVVLCSICYEGFPSVLVEAMLHGKPVICSCIGGLPEIVDDGVTGLLFEPGNVDDLVKKIQYLWDRPDLCREMGQAGREKALREYSPERYYERLMAVYRKAIDNQRNEI